MRLVIAGGTPRSASTQQFNCIRSAINMIAPNELAWSGWIEDFKNESIDLAGDSGFVLVKIHMFRQIKNLVKIHKFRQIKNFLNMTARDQIWVCTAHRDPRDAVLSQARKFGPEVSVSQIKNYCQNYFAVKSISDYDMKYEEFLKDKRLEVKKHLESMCKKFDLITPNDIGETAKNIENSLSELDVKQETLSGLYNMETMYHKNHFTSNGAPEQYKDCFSDDLINKINEECGEDIAGMGYPLR